MPQSIAVDAARATMAQVATALGTLTEDWRLREDTDVPDAAVWRIDGPPGLAVELRLAAGRLTAVGRLPEEIQLPAGRKSWWKQTRTTVGLAQPPTDVAAVLTGLIRRYHTAAQDLRRRCSGSATVEHNRAAILKAVPVYAPTLACHGGLMLRAKDGPTGSIAIDAWARTVELHIRDLPPATLVAILTVLEQHHGTRAAARPPADG